MYSVTYQISPDPDQLLDPVINQAEKDSMPWHIYETMGTFDFEADGWDEEGTTFWSRVPRFVMDVLEQQQ